MKWNEIPKFKEFGLVNPMNLGFIGYVEFIKEEIKKYDLQLNPDFQRGHIWTEEQQIKYIEFIMKGGKTGRDFYFNWNRISNEYVCVDGLQRTEAFIRFVDGKIKVFDQYFSEFGFTKFIAQHNPLPEYKISIYRNNLSDKKEMLSWYIDINSGGTPHTEDEIDRVKRMMEGCLNE